MFLYFQEITNEVTSLNNLQHCERPLWRNEWSKTLMHCKCIYLFTDNRPYVLAMIIKNTVFQSVTPYSGVTNQQHTSTLMIQDKGNKFLRKFGNLVLY
jgi:hypothetical protein